MAHKKKAPQSLEDLNQRVVVGLSSKKWHPREGEDPDEDSDGGDVALHFSTKAPETEPPGITTIVPHTRVDKAFAEIEPLLAHPPTGRSSLVMTHALPMDDACKVLLKCARGLLTGPSGLPVSVTVRVATFIPGGMVRYGGSHTFTDVVSTTRDVIEHLLENAGEEINLHDNGRSTPRKVDTVVSEIERKIGEVISGSRAIEDLGNEPGVQFDRQLPLEVIISRNLASSPLLITFEVVNFLTTPAEKKVQTGYLYFLMLNSVVPKSDLKWFRQEGVKDESKDVLTSRRRQWRELARSMDPQMHTWTLALRHELEDFDNPRAAGSSVGCGVERFVRECAAEILQGVLLFGAGFTPDAGRIGDREFPPVYSVSHLEGSERGGWSLGSAGGFDERLVQAWYQLQQFEPVDPYVHVPPELASLQYHYSYLARELCQMRSTYEKTKERVDVLDEKRAEMEAEIQRMEEELKRLIKQLEDFESDKDAARRLQEKREHAAAMAKERDELDRQVNQEQQEILDENPTLTREDLDDIDPATGLPRRFVTEHDDLVKKQRDVLAELDELKKRGDVQRAKDLQAELARLKGMEDDLKKRMQDLMDEIRKERGEEFLNQLQSGSMKLGRDNEDSSKLSDPSDDQWHRVPVKAPEKVVKEETVVEDVVVEKKGCCGGK